MAETSVVAFVDQFRELFKGRESFYGQYGDGAEKKIQTLKGAAPLEAWERHIRGEGPYLGQVPIRLDNTCYFGAIDIDDDGIDHQPLAAKVKEFKLPLIVCRSKSGGAHLYVFFREPVPAPIVVKTLKLWSAMLGHKQNADGRAVEIFPKQTAIRPKDSGNWINLPYYGADKSTRKAINADGKELTLAEFIAVAELLMVQNAAALSEIQSPDQGIFAHGPPCLQKLHTIGYEEGSRNNGLYNVAVFFKMAREDDWKNAVREYNISSFTPPLKPGEVDTIIASVDRRDYAYNCDELPISAHCSRGLCNKRRFGIARLRSDHSIKAFPEMTNLRKILTDPPRWLINIEGTDVELATEDLMQMPRLRKELFEKLNMVIPIIKVTDYDDILRKLISQSTQILAPEDAGTRGQFNMLVEMFLSRSRSAEEREDILQGLPFAEKGRIFFRSADLLSFLERKKFHKYSTAEVYSQLRASGAEHCALRTKKAVLKVWSMPIPGYEQTEDFDPVPAEKLGSEF